jgi:hypothetical protein
METGWVYLMFRYGKEVGSPDESQIELALNELFCEDLQGMTEQDYAEHGDASLRFGYDNGPMYVVDISRTGRATLSQWEDQDYYVELQPEIEMMVDREVAKRLWLLLAQGKIDEVKQHFA